MQKPMTNKSILENIILIKAPKNNNKPDNNSEIVTINKAKGTKLFNIVSEK
jgi:hypothetical protein